MKRKQAKRFARFRSAITGQYVTEEYARAHPETTVAETVKQKPTQPPPEDLADGGASS